MNHLISGARAHAAALGPDTLYPFEQKAVAAYTAAGGKVVASQAPDYYHKPEIYGRSPLENSSFIASSRFPDAKAHGVGFVARLSGATAEWISMVLHMGLGAAPFRVVDGAVGARWLQALRGVVERPVTMLL